MQDLNIVILAAGMGKRMYSEIPKVLHQVGNKSMLQHVIQTAMELAPKHLVIVYGHGGELVKHTINAAFPDNNFIWAHQEQQLGTGHALKSALPYIEEKGATLLLYGDVPLISKQTLSAMLDKYDNNIVMLTAQLENPTGYGRVLRDIESNINGIVEEKDATPGERQIQEINTGFYVFPNSGMFEWLHRLSNDNSQGEYYVTDLVAMAYQQDFEIDYVQSHKQHEIMGVNNKLQLEYLERIYQASLADKLLEAGATLMDKKRIDIRGSVSVGKDCVIDINCIFEGSVILANNVRIGANSILKNVQIGDGVEIKPCSIIEDAQIGDACQIGPFARIRPGTRLSSSVHVGNFVEIKKSDVGIGSKVNHLTYIGDATIGSKVNVGAGSVTCNYDGTNKFKTIIQDNVFVGSGTMMVAPVTLGEGSVIGAGSVITKDAPANELTVARAKQNTVVGWLQRTRRKS